MPQQLKSTSDRRAELNALLSEYSNKFEYYTYAIKIDELIDELIEKLDIIRHE